MVVRMRHTHSHTANRRSHHAIVATSVRLCKDCGQPKLPHAVCPNCGKYKGHLAVDISARLAKKEKKLKEKARN